MQLDIMTGENCRQFSLLTRKTFIGQFVHPVGGDGVKGESLLQLAACFTLLENVKIWCKIQVIIYPLSKITFL